ncbi:SMI1/KNR4 family protein [Kitasatospora sp. NPDC088391]|uniref:SMI1/KNR4 family protein n=1 Tax=Kitasatospora sp. NPDC088391 TaxID=3364074 RepID=UPI0037F5C649
MTDRDLSRPWPALLQEWSRLWLSPDAHEEVERRFPPEAHATGWFGTDGATEADIEALERRLGTRLPPSYREFLAVSNGWSHVDDIQGPLLPTQQVGWLRDLDPDLVECWSNREDDPAIPDEEYLRYDEDQESETVRGEYFRTALRISEWGDSALLMLNPAVVNPQGEWEAWAFARWYPGAYRQPSFWDLMVHLIKSDHPDADWPRLGL